MELQSRYADLQRQGMGVAAILYDPPEVLKAFADRMGIRVPMLSDTGSDVIRRYDLLNREIEPGSRSYGIPYPGTFILDAEGRVVARFFEARYQERFTVTSIATRLGEPLAERGASETRIETDHLTAVSFASDEVVAPGNRISLVVEVTPKPTMHVYAPGDHTYRVVKLRITTPPFARPHAVSYPPAEPYRFEPLNETVPVYQKPFRLVQDVTIPMSAETAALAADPGTALTIAAMLEYQACDDEICYLPAEVPVTWTLQWRPLVR